MSRDSNVTFDMVRQACYEILGRGQRPTRSAVQALLATDRYIGRKGSNEVVQSLVSEFWASMFKSLQLPKRSVDGVPEAFVPIIDKALGEMVAVARQMASAEAAERSLALDERARKIEADMEEARLAAQAADHSRICAESKLSALLSHADVLKERLGETERRLVIESDKATACQLVIAEKDAELRSQFVALETAGQTLEQSREQHRQEINRLLQQLDDERQRAIREKRQLTGQLEQSRHETMAIRDELATLRGELGGLQTQNAVISKAKAKLEAELSAAGNRIEELLTGQQAAQQEAADMRARYETTERLRQEMVALCASQAEMLGEMRGRAEQSRREPVSA